MGNNQAYTILEAQVIAAYNQAILTEQLLRSLMEPYRNSDIDTGGSQDITSQDGLLCEEIVVKVLRPEAWESAQGLDRDNGDYLQAS